ncbi:MAG: GNAT family N-acetyltransferase [Armatimonadota bacterium]
MDNFELREIRRELDECAEVIRKSFATVADEFNLTRENCPTHPSFMTVERLKDDLIKGVQIFGLFVDGRLVGTVMLDEVSADTCSMERLAVLPEYRHKGYGRMLIDHICTEVKKRGGQMISIAIIDEHTTLKRWYETYGFHVTHTKRFDHLPFTVCFMEKAIIE